MLAYLVLREAGNKFASYVLADVAAKAVPGLRDPRTVACVKFDGRPWIWPEAAI